MRVQTSPLFEIARVLVHLNQFASIIVHADNSLFKFLACYRCINLRRIAFRIVAPFHKTPLRTLMIFDSNLLKIAGALVAGLAGVIGILGQTRTQDKKLTRSGKWLFGMAVVGVVLAVSTQIWEWRKSIESDRVARLKNRELLLKLDTEVQLAAKSLHEVKRAVTRFQDISFDWSFSFDSADKVVGPYIHDLAKLAEDATSKPATNKAPFAEQEKGLLRLSWNPKTGEISGFRIKADSPAMPDETKYALLRHYIFEIVPTITLFKTSIPPEKFFTTWPMIQKVLDAPWNPLYDGPRPDLILKLKPENVTIKFRVNKAEPKVSRITVEHSGMIASVSDSWGTVVSVEDVDKCQGISHLFQKKELIELWHTATKPRLGCRINNQPITVSELTPTQTGYQGKHDQLIYSFTLSASNPDEIRH